MRDKSFMVAVTTTEDAFVLYGRNHPLTMWIIPFAALAEARHAANEAFLAGEDMPKNHELVREARNWFRRLSQPGCAGMTFESQGLGKLPVADLLSPYRVHVRRACGIWDMIRGHYRRVEDITLDAPVPHQLTRQKHHAIRVVV